MSDIAIRIHGLGKRYTIGAREQHDTLRDRIAAAASRPFRRMAPGGLGASTTIWALRDVTHEIQRGEVVGIIGGNGAGKSTLSKILSRITTPTEGEAEIHGRVGSLLESAWDFIPIIVDEVLAVGDVHFQRKCLGKLDDVARGGRTVLFVSHNMAAVQRLCTSAMLLEHGRLVESETSVPPSLRILVEKREAASPRQLAPVRLRFFPRTSKTSTDSSLESPSCSDPIVCRISFALPRRAPGTRVGIGVLGVDGTTVFTTNNADAGTPCPSGPGEFDACVTIPPNSLLAGEFHLALCLWNAAAILDLQEPALSFSVEPGGSALYAENATRKGYVHVDCPWSVAARVETPAAVLT